MITLKFRKLHPDATLPFYATPGAAGMDLTWDGYLHDLKTKKSSPKPYRAFYAHSKETLLFCTGLAVEIPEGWHLEVRPRSSMGLRGLIIANAPGTIDSDFRGEIMIELRSLDQPVQVEKGHRIAQMVLVQAPQAAIMEVTELSETPRGAKGYGSTGR